MSKSPTGKDIYLGVTGGIIVGLLCCCAELHTRTLALEAQHHVDHIHAYDADGNLCATLTLDAGLLKAGELTFRVPGVLDGNEDAIAKIQAAILAAATAVPAEKEGE